MFCAVKSLCHVDFHNGSASLSGAVGETGSGSV